MGDNSSMTTTALHALVSGRVQGVGFRWMVMQQARSLGVTGWVQNLSDGRVELCCEGDDDAVDQLIDWVKEGPQYARVDHLNVNQVSPQGFTRFEVR